MRSMAGAKRKRKSKVLKKVPVITREQFEALELDSRIALIQQLIPLGMMLATDELQREVARLAGPRYERKDDPESGISRYGTNPGSIKLAGQRIAIDVPRLRDPHGEVPLESYQMLHRGTALDKTLFRRVLYGVSCRNYEAAAEAIPGAIGLSKSTVSEQFISASSQQLKAFQERDLSALDIVAVFLDGKTFADDTMVIAMGITLDGQKVFLGFVQTDTENSRVLSKFLRLPVQVGAALDAQAAPAGLRAADLHCLGLFGLLGILFKTTNCLESINAQAEERCAKVDYWKNSNQKQRWLAAALCDIEPRLKRVKGHRHLPRLREAIMKELKLNPAALPAAA